MPFLDNTAAFGFGNDNDRLGRLNEINRQQVQNALRGINNFVATGANFMKNASSNRNKSVAINDI